MVLRLRSRVGIAGVLMMLGVAVTLGARSTSRRSPETRPGTSRTKPASDSELSLTVAAVANHKGDGPDGKGNTADDTWRFWFQLIHARGEYRPLDIATATMSPKQKKSGIRRKVRGPIGSMLPNPKKTEG
ncbi:MAG: hypothetical protein QGH94_20250 [Phycisphaerae bacterium]|nr:hypothetical protein [Phycisphaerae bacterium]